MTTIKGIEPIANPLQESELSKKGLCDYVVNVATGCLHRCTFCYVPSTPAVRMRERTLKERGVENPQLDWGKYLFVRPDVPALLHRELYGKRSWKETPAGKGVVLLCSTTDPYQNGETAKITREAVKVLLKFGKRVRILTRSPRWIDDLDILVNPSVTVGMSLPYLSDPVSRQIEPGAPLPSDRLNALKIGKDAGCRVFIAMAPTPPAMKYEHFCGYFEFVARIDPEVIFWEPINARGGNGKRMVAAGIDWAKEVSTRDVWADRFLSQWDELEQAAKDAGIIDRLHYWPDPALGKYASPDRLAWIGKPTIERWD